MAKTKGRKGAKTTGAKSRAKAKSTAKPKPMKRSAAAPKQKAAAPKQKAAAPKQKAAAPKQKAAAPKQKAAAPKKKAAASKQKAAAPKKAAAKKPGRAAPTSQPVADSMIESAAPNLAELAGRTMIVQLVGDAEAFFFDFTGLDDTQRRELIGSHLAAYDRRRQAEGTPDWHAQMVPIALLGESMPPSVRAQFDLSAPHEGVLLHHPETGAVLYAASKDDEKLALVAPDLEMLSPQPSLVDETFAPVSFAYDVDRTESAGFTLGQIEMLMQVAGAELTLV